MFLPFCQRTVKKHEKILKEIMKQLDSVTKKNSKNEENLRKREDQLTEAQKVGLRSTEGSTVDSA